MMYLRKVGLQIPLQSMILHMHQMVFKINFTHFLILSLLTRAKGEVFAFNKLTLQAEGKLQILEGSQFYSCCELLHKETQLILIIGTNFYFQWRK